MTWGAQPTVLVVGGYTPEQGLAEGLVGLRLASTDDGTADLTTVSVLTLPSPTFVVAAPGGGRVFAVSESRPAQVHAVDVDAGQLTLRSSVSTDGEGGCHLALSPAGDRLAMAEYDSGAVVLLSVDADGTLAVLDRLVLVGDGPDPERQRSAHAHQVVWWAEPGGTELLVPDLGADRVHRLRVADDRLVPAGEPVVLPPGTGPRHLVVLGPYLVVVGELAGTLWLGCRATGGGWEQLEVLPCCTVPTPGVLYPSALVAAPAPSGDGYRLWVANRGPDTIAELRLDAATGRLEHVVETSCGGVWPRDLTLARERLWVANQDGHTLSVFDPARLSAGPELVLDAASPACVVVL